MRLRKHQHPQPIAVHLRFQVRVDRDWMDAGHTFYLVRLVAEAHFPRTDGATLVQEAIIDTGSPLSIIRRPTWELARVRHTGQLSAMDGPLRGAPARGELGLVPLHLADTEHVSPPLTVRALLLEDDSLPLILGFGDLLIHCRLVCDFPANTALLEFPLHAA